MVTATQRKAIVIANGGEPKQSGIDMSKAEAQKVLEWASGSPEMCDFIILYKPFSVFGSREELIYAVSPKLRPHFPGFEGEPLSAYVEIEENNLHFLLPKRDGPYTVRVIPASWGTQIYVYLSKAQDKNFNKIFLDFSEWIANLNKAAKLIAGVFLSVGLVLVSVLDQVKQYIPIAPTPAPATQDEGKLRLKKILEKAFYEMPSSTPISNGLIYWDYSESCDRRILVDGYTPFISPNYWESVRSRNTDEAGWDDILAAHRKGKIYVAKRDTLPDKSALAIAMDGLGVDVVLTVPVEPVINGCPKGYLSQGYTRELTQEQVDRIAQKMRSVSMSVSAWAQLAK